MSTELSALATEVKSAVTSMRSTNEELKTKMAGMQTQLDAIDATTRSIPHGSAPQQTSQLVKSLSENEPLARMMKEKRGKVFVEIQGGLMQRKSILTENVSGSIGTDTGVAAGLMTTGVLPIDRTAGITTEARPRLRVRDVLASSPTDAAIVDMVKVSTPMSIASPVAEGSLKPENQLNLSSSSERVKTIAHYLIASRQILDDMPSLAAFIGTSGVYYLALAEERQLLSGDGTGENLHGLIPQATGFNTGLLPSAPKGWNKIDVLGAAIEQITIASELDPTFVVLNPKDFWDIRLVKDGFGRYLLGDPQQVVSPNLFGLNLVWTPSIAVGTFLVGSGSPIASEIKDRMLATVEISTETNDAFLRNLVYVRIEERLALLTRRPASYITGSFSTSP